MAYFTTEKDTKRPEGKEKIYLTGHPDELHLLKEMTGEILKFHDGRVLVAEQMQRRAAGCEMQDLFPGEEWEIHLETLQQVNLIVVVVTSKFLLEESFAKQELRFAKENHITLLPILVESGLEPLFDQVCGEVHLLNRNDGQYKQKLEAYFREIFGDDDLRDVVNGISTQQVFSGQIFLSYRKKDRREALALMKKIHNIEFCQDIAIWFDDYLRPGENYNEDIDDNLKKSDLVVLNVTPSLLEAGNYVKEVEYPAALMAEKQVLPVITKGKWSEVNFTGVGFENGVKVWSRQELVSSYPGLEELVGGEDSVALESALVERLKKAGMRRLPYTPERMYWLGEAYMRGYYVEIDRNRGIGLMTKAAEAGVIRAMYRLALHYKAGDGVERDLAKARMWMERNVAKLQEGFHAGSGDDWSRALAESLAQLSDICFFLKDTEAAREALDRMADVSNYNAQLGFVGTGTNQGAIYLRLGIMAQDEGDYRQAESYYAQAEDILHAMFQNTGTPQAVRNYALLLKKQAELDLRYEWNRTKNPEFVQQGLEKVIEAEKLQKWLVDVGGEDYDGENYNLILWELASAYSKRGALQTNARARAIDFNEARDTSIKLLMRKDLSVDLRPDVEKMIAQTTMWAGVATEQVDVSCAEALHREAYLAYSDLCKRQKDDETYFGLANACINLAVFNQDPPQLELLQQALRILNMLYVNHPENEEYRTYLSATLQRVKAWPKNLG